MASESDFVYEKLLRPLLFNCDPEAAHNVVYDALPIVNLFSYLVKAQCSFESSRLESSIAGQAISSPIGLAAGFDKNGKLGGLLDCLGFGFAEIGSVTNLASDGNPKPRLFRLAEDEAVINRMGLNGEGAEAVARRLEGLSLSVPFAVNIAKTNRPELVGDKGIEDVVSTFSTIRHLPLTYVVLNASCPNTHEGCQKETSELSIMLTEIYRLNSKKIPLFVKLSPDSSDDLINSILSVASSNTVSGYICGNTSTSRDGLQTSVARLTEIGNGGLSGRPVKEKALALCRKIASGKESEQEIIGCGGIFSGDDAYEFLQAGAHAIEIYTAMVYQGPKAVRRISERLDELLRRDQTTMLELVRSHSRGTVAV